MVRDVVAGTSPYAAVVNVVDAVVSRWVRDVVAGAGHLAVVVVVVVDVASSRWVRDVVNGGGLWAAVVVEFLCCCIFMGMGCCCWF